MAQAHWLLADIYLATGQADKAVTESAAALEIEPDNSAYQLRHAEALELVRQLRRLGPRSPRRARPRQHRPGRQGPGLPRDGRPGVARREVDRLEGGFVRHQGHRSRRFASDQQKHQRTPGREASPRRSPLVDRPRTSRAKSTKASPKPSPNGSAAPRVLPKAPSPTTAAASSCGSSSHAKRSARSPA